jgi:hypothetical protein
MPRFYNKRAHLSGGNILFLFVSSGAEADPGDDRGQDFPPQQASPYFFNLEPTIALTNPLKDEVRVACK